MYEQQNSSYTIKSSFYLQSQPNPFYLYFVKAVILKRILNFSNTDGKKTTVTI